MNLLKIIFLSSVLLLTGFKNKQGDFCGIKNTAFSSGETVQMTVFYSALGAYIGAGEATFTTNLERYNGKPVYHAVGVGKTYPFFDNFFKVRDRYESYIDTATLNPYKFIRNVEEGGTKIYNNVTFNHTAGTAVSTNGVFKTPNCIQDVVSSIYYARNINFDQYKENSWVGYEINGFKSTSYIDENKEVWGIHCWNSYNGIHFDCLKDFLFKLSDKKVWIDYKQIRSMSFELPNYQIMKLLSTSIKSVILNVEQGGTGLS
jgi:hypothetical protein